MSHDLFDVQVNREMMSRLAAIPDGRAPEWGKLNAAEMCNHCARPMQVALGERELDGPWFLKLFGRLMKKSVVGPKPFKKDLPTAAAFIPDDTRDFAAEREHLRQLIERFAAGPSCLSGAPHPFFGPLEPREWSTLMGKHLDHHLRQFGV
jgi:uncharacterized protein DUF1569